MKLPKKFRQERFQKSGIESYLRRHGWRIAFGYPKYRVWLKVIFEVLVPTRQTQDFMQRISELIETLVVSENQYAAEIINEIHASGTPKKTELGLTTAGQPYES